MKTPRFMILCGLVVSAAVLLLLTGHGPHVIGYLPYLFLLACPLMHLLMHGHHKRRGPRGSGR